MLSCVIGSSGCRVVDPNLLWCAGSEGARQGRLALSGHLIGTPGVDIGRREQRDSRVTMLMVVPVEEGLAVGTRVFDADEACRDVGAVLQRLELRLRVRVVVGGVRGAVQFQTNVIDYNRPMQEMCEQENVSAILRGPLAMGLLGGKYDFDSVFPDNDIRGPDAPKAVQYFKGGRPNPD